MTFGRLQIHPGMHVVGTAGADVGEVTHTAEEDFVVRHPDGREASVPYDAIRAMLGDEIVLNVTAGEVGYRESSERSD